MEKGEFSARLRHIRTSLGLGQSEFAQNLDIPRTSLINYEKGVSSPSIEFVSSLKKKFAVDADWFLTGEGNPFIKPNPNATAQSHLETANLQALASLGSSQLPAIHENRYKIPLLKQKVSCGTGANWESEDNIEEYLNIDIIIPHLGIGRALAMKAHGSSMLGADIKSGDILVINASNDLALIDGIYAFALDGEVYCKRLEFDKLDRKIRIFSMRYLDMDKSELITTIDTNDMHYSERFFIYGRVVKIIRTVYSEE